MNIFKIREKIKAFTLIELLIVVTILSILAAVIFISYTGFLKNSRDGKRKSDLQTIASAYLIHHQETKRWDFNNTELQKILPGTTALAEGDNGDGWYNYIAPPIYTVSISDALFGLNYISSKVRDPLITSDSDTYIENRASQYMKYKCYDSSSAFVGVFLFARLEDENSINAPFSEDSNPDLDKCVYGGGLLKDYLSTTYKMNYAVEVK